MIVMYFIPCLSIKINMVCSPNHVNIKLFSYMSPLTKNWIKTNYHHKICDIINVSSYIFILYLQSLLFLMHVMRFSSYQDHFCFTVFSR